VGKVSASQSRMHRRSGVGLRAQGIVQNLQRTRDDCRRRYSLQPHGRGSFAERLASSSKKSSVRRGAFEKTGSAPLTSGEIKFRALTSRPQDHRFKPLNRSDFHPWKDMLVSAISPALDSTYLPHSAHAGGAHCIEPTEGGSNPPISPE
jgi:hypothetical protein